MNNTSLSYEEGLWEDLQNPTEAAAYLNAALEDSSSEVFLLALRDVAKAKEKTVLQHPSTANQDDLFHMLSETENPLLSNVLLFLDNLGLTLTVKTKKNIPT